MFTNNKARAAARSRKTNKHKGSRLRAIRQALAGLIFLLGLLPRPSDSISFRLQVGLTLRQTE